MRVIRVFCLSLLLMSTVGVSAQLVDKVLDIFHEDSVRKVTAIKSDSDTVQVTVLQKELAAAKLNEANLRMEMEQMRLKSYGADSVKLAQQKLRIDSLRKVTPGVPVVVEGDTLYYLYAKRGGLSPQQRAETNAQVITELGKRFKLNDTTGNVIEMTPLATRIRTPKNEVITIPNSFIMSSHTVNFSQSAREFGLIIHSEVAIGYDAPWRQVHQLLIDAALNTPGVEIMSPHYMAMRDGNETTIPKNDLRGEGKGKE